MISSCLSVTLEVYGAKAPEGLKASLILGGSDFFLGEWNFGYELLM